MTMLLISLRWLYSLTGTLLLAFVIAGSWPVTDATTVGSGGPLFESSHRTETACIAGGGGEKE
jgi:hypothetical protein